MTKVFISYSHDSDEHRQKVLALADHLNENDIDCEIDQYINGSPSEGWPLWMERMLEESTYVLVVCTETYLNRVRRKEKSGTGKGVKWESLLTYQDIYENDSLNSKFLPIIFETTDAVFVPKPLKAFRHYDLSCGGSYEMLYRYLTGQPVAVKPTSKGKLHLPPSNVQTATIPIHSDRLPDVKGKFFGREAELKLLDDAWAGNGTHIVQFIAPGGTGKTKLLRHWLDRSKDIDALIAWSFYSQGSSEDKQISASPFFRHVFEELDSTRTTFATEEDRGKHLADLLRQQRCVLVLDGLEPLQYAGKGMQNNLKDRAVRQLLKSIAGQNNGLCIITTRIAVPELTNHPSVVSHDLQNLVVDDGVKLLQSLGVKGSGEELEKAVTEYGCHALALSLLGNALHTYLDDDVRKRDTLTELIGDYDDLERHAFKVMQAYSIWLDGTPELKLLQLLGLFDHPIETEVLQMLWQAQIPYLTVNIDERAWKVAIRDLREKLHLLSMHENRPDLLDCHPLIREYFGEQLRDKQAEAWRQAHTRLYEYYKTLPKKEFPDTLEEIQPLFNAVAHGCAAGLHQQTLDEVYWSRIRRGENHFLTKKLGAYSDDLAVVAHFFDPPWHAVVSGLIELWQYGVLAWASSSLHALTRLRESLELGHTAIELAIKNEKWDGCAQNAVSLSERLLALGDLKDALIYSQSGMDYADQCTNKPVVKLFLQINARANHAHILHQVGETTRAYELFADAKQRQQRRQPQFPHLYSQPGFYYRDLLLDQYKSIRVLKYAKYALEISQRADGEKGMSLLDIALDQLSFGCAYLQQGEFPEATSWLNQAVSSFRTARRLDDLPLALLARAALYRDTRNPSRDFTRARQDLQEVFDIAEPSGMRLHLTDYHLEMARLLIAEKENPPQSPFFKGGSSGGDVVAIPPLEKGGLGGISVQEHVAQAAKLIEETGYKRRLPELLELQQRIREQPLS